MEAQDDAYLLVVVGRLIGLNGTVLISELLKIGHFGCQLQSSS